MAGVFKSNKGTAVILFVLVFSVLAVCTSLVIDVGELIIEKGRISNACDASVMAAAAELQNNPLNAVPVAEKYLKENGIDLSETQITVADDKKSIRISINRNVKFYFARFIGFDQSSVKAQAEAAIQPITGVAGGIRPFAIVDQELVYGQNYVLKEGAGSGSTGNYDMLALGGKGASVVSYNIVNGYDGSLNVGESITTEPGNMAGPVTSSVQSLIYQDPTSTFDNYKLDSPRIITVIVVNTINVTGSSPVTICGFASFFLEDVQGTGGDTQIVGKFIKTVITGKTSPSQTNYGLVGIKLLN